LWGPRHLLGFIVTTVSAEATAQMHTSYIDNCNSISVVQIPPYPCRAVSQCQLAGGYCNTDQRRPLGHESLEGIRFLLLHSALFELMEQGKAVDGYASACADIPFLRMSSG